MNFKDLHLDDKIVEVLERTVEDHGMGLKQATKIQQVAIPLLKEKKNVLMKSETGSGKTLAYLLPMINDLMDMDPPVQRTEGTRALIIAPTRELCSQIADVLSRITRCCVRIVGGCITGGEKKKSEKARLRKGVVILVATPGRLLDHLRTTESFTLQLVRWLILDEADRLLDMGFEQTILEIFSIIRGERLPGLKSGDDGSGEGGNRGHGQGQGMGEGGLERRWKVQVASLAKQCRQPSALVHVMVSATLSAGVKRLAGPVMGGSGFVLVDADRGRTDRVDRGADLLKLGKDVGRLDGLMAGSEQSNLEPDESEEHVQTPARLAQFYMTVPCKWRLGALVSFLRVHRAEKLVVFFCTCDSVDYHALLLQNTEWPTGLDAPDYNPGEEDEVDASKIAAHASAASSLEPLGTSFTGMPGELCRLYRLHGSVPQRVRQEVFREFAAAQRGVLLCTDVAARGLDLPKVDWILQYDPPCETADYVHRVGRTARRGLAGQALIFLLPSEAAYVSLLSSHGLMPSAMPVQSLFLEAAKAIPGVAKFKNVDEMTAVTLQRRLERVVYRNRPLLDAGRQAFRSFVRAYATHSADSKGIFRVQTLHLGHVAKSFALRESPKAIRNHDDVIGKIFNGEFSAERLEELQAKRRLGGGGRDRGGGGERRESGRKRVRDGGKDRDDLAARRRIEKRQKLSGAPAPGGSVDARSSSSGSSGGGGVGGGAGGGVRKGFDKEEASSGTSTIISGSGSGSGGGPSASSSPSSSGVSQVPTKTAASSASSVPQRKLRPIGKALSLVPASTAASGRFRKTNGYFRKKLRAQSSAEFHA